MWIRTGTSLLVALQLSLVAQLALPRKTAPLMQMTSGFLRRSMPETSLPSARSPGLQPRKKPLQGGPFEEEQWGLGPRRKVSLQTRGFDAGLPRKDEIRSSAAESLRKLSSTPIADFAGGLPRRAGRMRITRTDQLSRDALLRGGSSLLRGGASFVEEQASRPSTLRDYARRRNVFEAASGLATLSVELELLELGLLEPFDATLELPLACPIRSASAVAMKFMGVDEPLRTALSADVYLRLGQDSGELTLYVLRHARPSHDRLSGARPSPATQRRGLWALESSARRHEKSSRATSHLKDFPEELLVPAHRCDRHLGSTLDGSVAVPQLPSVLAKRRKLAT